MAPQIRVLMINFYHTWLLYIYIKELCASSKPFATHPNFAGNSKCSNSMTFTENVKRNNYLFGKELFIRFTASAFRKLPSIMYLVISLLVLRAGCGI